MAEDIRIVTYDPQYRASFKELNLDWINEHFKVEKKDLEQVENPEDCLSGGGQIFFAVAKGGSVGTCALYKVGDSVFELAKMAVAHACRGRGLGDLLMREAEAWAESQGARRVIILSNTVLRPAINLYLKHGYLIEHQGPHPDYERCNIVLGKELMKAGEKNSESLPRFE